MKVMLLIDADNVSVDVIQQAVKALLDEHGAVHVRRAYCTAESAAKHQTVFKRLGIRPMVNLAAGKNSTDIALAVDAIDLVIAERPDVVAIASSDSDFAPLVGRLREKGCRVVGLGQEGKTGDETITVYDAYTVLAHRKARTAAPKAAAKAPAPAKAAPKTPAKKTTRRKAAEAAPPPTPERPEAVRAILAAMPELLRGEALELRVAAERLRDAGLVGQRAAPVKLLRQHPESFELVPAKAPNQVRLRP
jgi:uncharacterized protein (TIGR00288 family)